MPSRPKRACNHPGCPALADSTYCPKHTRERSQRYERDRGTSAQRGYGARWRRARAQFLDEHPLCRRCQSNGVTEPATVVDHIDPHKGDMALFWDRGNWQPLCKACHDRKTASEDGRWGGS